MEFIRKHAFTALGAALIALALGCSHYLTGPEDHQADWTQSDALKELQASAAGSARRDAAAQRLCNEARGPLSEARWTPEGHLVCTMRQTIVKAAL